MSTRDKYTTEISVEFNPESKKLDIYRSSLGKWVDTLGADSSKFKDNIVNSFLKANELKESYQNITESIEKINNLLQDTTLPPETRDFLRGKSNELQNQLKEVNGQLDEKGLSDYGSDKFSFKEKISDFIKGDEGSFGQSLKSAAWSTFGPKSDLATTIVSGFKKVLDTVVSFVWDNIKEAFKNLKEMASYNLSTTKTFNTSAVELMEEWGLVGDQAYAVSEGLKQSGLSSIDDLFKAQSYGMQGVVEEFQENYERSLEEYNNTDQELITKYEQFQDEWKDFKDTFQKDLLEFFSNNKSLITDTLNTLINILPGLLTVTKAILNAIGWLLPGNSLSTTRTASDIYESYGARSNNSQYSTTNSTYNFNGITNEQMNNIKSGMNKGNVNYYYRKAIG